MSHPLRIGVAGAGFMGRQHIDLIRAEPQARLVAVADPLVPADAYECPVHPRVHDMLAAGGLDAVLIANPSALHVDTAIACLDAGVAVLLEKPVATGYADALRLVDAVRRRSGRLLVGHHRRHHHAVQRARQAFADGDIGELVAVSGLWSARKEDAYFTDTAWHRQPGAGVLLINVVHDLDLLRHLCGEVAQVQALASSQARGLVVEDTVSIGLRFADGLIGSFLASDAGVSPWGWDQATEETVAFPFLPDEAAYRFVGTRGALSVPNLARYSYDPSVSPDWHSPLSRTYLPVAPHSTFAAQLRHFVDVARGDAPPLVSAEDASLTLALVEATARAARAGTLVDVADFRAEVVRASQP